MAGKRLALAGTGWIEPDWPAPECVRAVSTTRAGGCSGGPYASLNLGLHVGDRVDAVNANRNTLATALGLDSSPRWLNQVHGNLIVRAAEAVTPMSADASITSAAQMACVVMTADCLPILLCDDNGDHVAAVHGGWRGLAGGVIEAAVAAFAGRQVKPGALICWLGPAISCAAYEVGEEVRDALSGRDAAALSDNSAGRWQLDLYRLARIRLEQCGVTRIFGGGLCTHTNQARFFSYRRDGACGRQATLIWRQH
jgi:YfiH family protein